MGRAREPDPRLRTPTVASLLPSSRSVTERRAARPDDPSPPDGCSPTPNTPPCPGPSAPRRGRYSAGSSMTSAVASSRPRHCRQRCCGDPRQPTGQVTPTQPGGRTSRRPCGVAEPAGGGHGGEQGQPEPPGVGCQNLRAYSASAPVGRGDRRTRQALLTPLAPAISHPATAGHTTARSAVDPDRTVASTVASPALTMAPPNRQRISRGTPDRRDTDEGGTGAAQSVCRGHVKPVVSSRGAGYPASRSSCMPQSRGLPLVRVTALLSEDP